MKSITLFFLVTFTSFLATNLYSADLNEEDSDTSDFGPEELPFASWLEQHLDILYRFPHPSSYPLEAMGICRASDSACEQKKALRLYFSQKNNLEIKNFSEESGNKDS